jgi:flagellar P-ring protein precursor FlgI
MKKLLALLFVALTAYSFAQQNPPAKPDSKRDQEIKDEMARRMQNMKRAELNGVAVRIKDVARFRGVRSNKLMGVGVVVGLQGTGDSRKNAQVSQAIQNYMKSMNFDIDVSRMDARNGALVIVSGDLPPFATNGQLMDVTVSTFGDAQSLRGGQLLRTELYAIGDSDTVYGIAEGAVSVGGFGASAGGNQQQVGFLTAGRVAGGGMVEKGAPTKLVYDNRMFIELYEVDLTTATRVQEAINKRNPEFEAVAESGSTISVSLPKGMNPIVAMAKLEEITVMVDNAAVVIVNEKTGSIAIGGNVKIAPVAIALGSISVNIVEEVSVSQPNPFSRNGDTAVVVNQRVSADQGPADVAVVAPNSTIADLARIFQELRLKPNDIINILQLLKQQGALKARLIFQ